MFIMAPNDAEVVYYTKIVPEFIYKLWCLQTLCQFITQQRGINSTGAGKMIGGGLSLSNKEEAASN